MKKQKKEVYQLVEPLTIGEETIEEVTIRRKLQYLRSHTLKAGIGRDDEIIVNIDFGTLIDLASKMTAQPASTLDEMNEEDQGYIMSQAQDFLFKALGTGKSK